nr:hypothetical protein [uncultured Sphingobacterium sp.]
MPWYVFNPSGPSPHPIGNMAFYDAPQILPPDCPGPKISLCAIHAEDNQGEPIITTDLALEIVTALSNKEESANVRLREFVCLFQD